MKHIFENLKKYWYFVILILALLVVQAYCDLSLPDYTSNIIDVGIVNGGVEHQMPEFITENSYNSLKLFLNEQETKDWDNAYEFSKSDKAYKLKNTDKDNMEELDSEFGNVIAVYYMMSSQQDSQFKNMSGNAQQMTPEQQQEMAKKLQEFGVDPQSPTLMYDFLKRNFQVLEIQLLVHMLRVLQRVNIKPVVRTLISCRQTICLKQGQR